MRFINWFGFKGKEKTGKTGAVWSITGLPVSTKEILSSPYLINFDFEEE